METSNQIDYQRIEKAIEYLKTNFKQQPSLEDIAEHVYLSPFHFQRMFTAWAGVSPKQFLQYLSIEYAKGILKKQKGNLSEAAYETGLSGTSRLHDLFIKIEGMTPGEFKNGGQQLQINYSYAESPFGPLLVASTTKGICYMAFSDDPDQAFSELQQLFPNAQYQQLLDRIQQNALYIFSTDWNRLSEVKLHLKGTDFQIKVWETLLKVPSGELATYADIANTIENPKANRAVGTAVGSNPIAFLIPCHRVIKSTGELGQYHWGAGRKTAMIGWEAAKNDVKPA
ncbi:methylated-DNA--[protein]-cysteine S-methyltransferase [Pedobacter sp. PLR]|uniref:bifunctional helix-turn-helix domain-containing protein/methylated-DNA--[protein]-cysteine S-methyltransferase n=1 Tax=Pedobacter sp. PLR TaxID=2994465 RepID=UPI0022485AC6|nr:methylated-DNA--[protein]-cysteine S-methyltransferase [Pedobacter sp. PLR]MCX2450824.1 methylated-DNA--[protein]-cysteine S-methyltransferase [Pedobacter sp. PLR]